MRTTYRILAYLIAAEVAVQAAALAFGFAGLSHWVQTGGVLDSAVIESDETPFPEFWGLIVHGINGSVVIPLLALVLLVCSFFAKVPRGVAWAVGVFVLVAVQVMLGFSVRDLPALGALHGLNALLLFATAFLAARRARARVEPTVAAETSPSAAKV
jgi:heme A synthase